MPPRAPASATGMYTHASAAHQAAAFWCEREAQRVPGARLGGAASAAARNQSVSQQIRVNVATTQQQ